MTDDIWRREDGETIIQSGLLGAMYWRLVKKEWPGDDRVCVVLEVASMLDKAAGGEKKWKSAGSFLWHGNPVHMNKHIMDSWHERDSQYMGQMAMVLEMLRIYKEVSFS
jgi:hypothetical protein